MGSKIYKHIKFVGCVVLLSLIGCGESGHRHNEEEQHEDEAHSHSGHIVFEPEQAEQFGIEVTEVYPSKFNDVIKTTGSIEPSQTDVATVSAKKSGIITLSSSATVGTTVKNGTTLAAISSSGIQGSEAPKVAGTNLEALKAEYERLKPLYEDGLVTASVFMEAQRAYLEAEALSGYPVQQGESKVAAPSEGTLQNLYVKSGDYVEVGTPIATIVKNSTQILCADLPAREARHLPDLVTANFIPEGATTALKISDLNGRKISGDAISGGTNGYVPVYFSFTGNPLLAPQGYAEVFLICGERDNVISVPRTSLIEIQGEKYVYVSSDSHSYEKRLVKTGASDGERIEILDGLREGDKVVTKGASVIRMAEVSAIAPPAHTHNH